MSDAVYLDDTSPLIKYQGQWTGAVASYGAVIGDTQQDSYQNKTWHHTIDPTATAIITWVGTGINVYGAYRSNHWYYSASLDNAPKVYTNGYAYPDQFQVSLYNISGLTYGQHTLVLGNESAYARTARETAGDPYRYFDIDYMLVVGEPVNPSPQIFANSISQETPATTLTSSSNSPSSSTTTTTSSSRSTSSFSTASSSSVHAATIIDHDLLAIKTDGAPNVPVPSFTVVSAFSNIKHSSASSSHSATSKMSIGILLSWLVLRVL